MTASGNRPLLVYGAGGFAREVAWLAERAMNPREVVAFIDDADYQAPSVLAGKSILKLADAAARFPDADVTVAVGSSRARETMTQRALAAGLRTTTLIHRNVEMSDSVRVGDGTVICAGCILTVDITIGAHVQINLDCTLGHDDVLEDYVTIAPGAHISGWVRLERGAYVGTGAAIINGVPGQPLVVGAGAVIGAGAVVTKSVPPGVTAVGVPARVR